MPFSSRLLARFHGGERRRRRRSGEGDHWPRCHAPIRACGGWGWSSLARRSDVRPSRWIELMKAAVAEITFRPKGADVRAGLSLNSRSSRPPRDRREFRIRADHRIASVWWQRSEYQGRTALGCGASVPWWIGAVAVAEFTRPPHQIPRSNLSGSRSRAWCYPLSPAPSKHFASGARSRGPHTESIR